MLNFLRSCLRPFVLGALMSLAAVSAAHAEASVTDQYLETYLKGDIAGLEGFMAEEMHFHDSTAWFDGKAEVMAGLTQVFNYVLSMSFEETARTQSGLDTLVMGTLTFGYAGRAMGVPERDFLFEIPFSVAVREVEGKITSHIDYVDSPAFAAQFRAQMEAGVKAD